MSIINTIFVNVNKNQYLMREHQDKNGYSLLHINSSEIIEHKKSFRGKNHKIVENGIIDMEKATDIIISYFKLDPEKDYEFKVYGTLGKNVDMYDLVPG